jgi:4-hydroxymandelate oxidase
MSDTHDSKLTRRNLLTGLGAMVAGSSVVSIAQSPAAAPARVQRPIAPRGELVNVPEFGDVAKLKLDASVFATIAPEDRQAIDLITLRPRMLVNTMKLDLAVTLLGEKMELPMLAGPTPDQKRLHPNGELEMLAGATASNVPMIVNSRSSVPFDQIAAQAKTPLWFYIAVDEPNAAARIQQAVQARVRAVCLAPSGAGTGARKLDWAAIDRLRQGVNVPVLVAGISTAADASAALQHGVGGIIVTKGAPASVKTAAMAVLPAVADAVAGKVPILLDDTPERGQDIFKALSLGAQAVLVTRPAAWGLAAYGAPGVESVFTMLMTELAKVMSACGKVNVAALDRTAVKVHAGIPKTVSQ